MKKKTKKNKVAYVTPLAYPWSESFCGSSSFASTYKEKPPKFVALYQEMVKDESFIDAWETFYDKKELINWFKGDNGARKIKVYPLGKEIEVRKSVSLGKRKKK